VQETNATITRLLEKWRGGDREAENHLFELVLPRLHRLASYLMSRERRDHTLQATELVDEVYIRLVAAQDRDWRNRQHFYAIAARAMRRLLIDYARGRPRAGVLPLEQLETVLPSNDERLEQALEIDAYLDELAAAEADWCTIVELKFFVGLTDDETAEAMGVGLRTMQRMWRDARHWLFQRMEAEKCRTRPKMMNG
jgi:RNA polymerase sigma factor (TIGR02999 family)